MRQLVITKQITVRSEESINRYFNEINKYPMISVEEEVELSARIRSGDTKALEKLVLANLRFVISVAKQYQNQGLSFSDLINEGNYGLVKAASKFDETRGFKFISYAVWWIRQSIIQAISEQTRIVRLPLNRLTSIQKIAKAIPLLEQELEREPTEEELADFTELSSEQIAYVDKIKKRQVSFDKPLSNDDDDFSLYDLIENDSLPKPDNDLMNESVTTDINRALKKLSAREADILTMSFGLNHTPALSIHDIASNYQMSSERVRQIKSRGLMKLRKLFESKTAFLDN